MCDCVCARVYFWTFLLCSCALRFLSPWTAASGRTWCFCEWSKGFNTNMQLAGLLPLTKFWWRTKFFKILHFFTFFWRPHFCINGTWYTCGGDTRHPYVNIETTAFLRSHVETFDVHCKLEFRECWFRAFEKKAFPPITAEQSYNVASDGEGGQGRFSWPRFRSGQSHNCRVWGRARGKQYRSSTYGC